MDICDNGFYNEFIVEDEENGGPRCVWLFHKVLREKFTEQSPKVGERIGIKRLPDAAKGYRNHENGGENRCILFFGWDTRAGDSLGSPCVSRQNI